MKPLSGWFRRRETPEVPEERATSVHGRGLALHHAQTSISRSALSLWGEGPDGLSWRFRGSEPLGSPLLTLILSRADWEEISALGEGVWVRSAQDTLKRLMAQEDVQWLSEDTDPCIDIVCDGGPQLRRYSIGLEAGRFASVILPHCWPHPGIWPSASETRKRRRVLISTPRLGVELHEAGWLWEGQSIWTIGSDWLDSATLPPGGEPALVTLQQSESGTIKARTAGGLRCEVRRDSGRDVVLVRADNSIVLQVVLEPPQIGDRRTAKASEGRRPSKKAPQPHATLAAMVEVNATDDERSGELSDTLYGAASEPQNVRLVWRGVLLPEIAFPDLFEGYERAIDRQGRVCASRSDEAVLVVRVLKDRMQLETRAPRIQVGGRELAPGRRVAISAGTRIRLPGEVIVDIISPPEAASDAFRGAIVGAAEENELAWGRRYTLGRGASSDLRLMDDPEPGGLIWKRELRNVGSVRVAGGMVPRNRFRLDAIMVSSEHACLDLTGEPTLEARSSRTGVWVVRNGEAFQVRKSDSTPHRALQPGDWLWVGQQLFRLETSGRELRNPLNIRVDDLVACALDAARALQLESDSAEVNPADLPSAGMAPPSPVVSETLIREPSVAAPEAGLSPIDLPSGPPPPVVSGPVHDSILFDPDEHGELPKPPPEARRESDTFEFQAEPPRPVVKQKPKPAAAAPSLDVLSAVAVDDAKWDWELSRPYLLRLEGWLVQGAATVGTHHDASILIPIIASSGKTLPASVTYANIQATRSACRFETGTSDSSCSVDDDGQELRVVRRNASGEVDHEVVLLVGRPSWSRNPMQWLIGLGDEDPVARALVDRGVDVEEPRTIRSGEDAAQLVGLADGSGIRARRVSGRSVHLASTSGRLRALASADEVVPVGGRIRIGNAVYIVEGA